MLGYSLRVLLAILLVARLFVSGQVVVVALPMQNNDA